MKSVRERRKEAEFRRTAERKRRKRSKTPVQVEIEADGLKFTVPLSQQYAPIIKRTGDNKLINIANRYALPLTQEQSFLLETGDRFLEQYKKKDIPEEEQYELYAQGWNPLVSSNLKAVRVEDEDLQILFHSEAIYEYPNQADMYNPFSEALSPGRLLWRTIRTIRGYKRIA
jgi:hypothetical protein